MFKLRNIEALQTYFCDRTWKIKATIEIITGQIYILITGVGLHLSAKGILFPHSL